MKFTNRFWPYFGLILFFYGVITLVIYNSARITLNGEVSFGVLIQSFATLFLGLYVASVIQKNSHQENVRNQLIYSTVDSFAEHLARIKGLVVEGSYNLIDFNSSRVQLLDSFETLKFLFKECAISDQKLEEIHNSLETLNTWGTDQQNVIDNMVTLRKNDQSLLMQEFSVVKNTLIRMKIGLNK